MPHVISMYVYLEISTGIQSVQEPPIRPLPDLKICNSRISGQVRKYWLGTGSGLGGS